MRSERLNNKRIVEELSTVPMWSLEGSKIGREFRFPNFISSIGFVVRLADAAEALNHHPDIDIRYDKVRLTLSTHDVGGLTANDFILARQVDELSEQKQLERG